MNGLFTVLIAEKEHIDAIQQENRLFFEPFLNNKNIAFCPWNPLGQNLCDSVPGLMDAVGRRKSWRAVIIDRRTEKSTQMRNPFDAVQYGGAAALNAPNSRPLLEESKQDWENAWRDYYAALLKQKEAVYKSALEYPLQKLATWLCFKAEDYILNDVSEKQNVDDWAIEMLGGDDFKPGIKLELMEREQYKNEQRIKETLRREFAAGNLLNIAYPTEMHCIAIRTAQTSFFDPDAYWNTRLESEYSAFADRNMYFDKMRFTVFDLLPKSHRDFRSDYIRFLACVLLFISNPVPSSAMKARRLYKIEAETDETPLSTLVTSYDKKLMATAEVIESEMERIRGEIPDVLTDKAAEALFCKPADIAVILDESCDTGQLYGQKNYGLFFDSPENEFYKWNKDRGASQKSLGYIVKQQGRSVKKSVVQMHMASRVSDGNISRLTPFQIKDVADYTDNAEDEMVDNVPDFAGETALYAKRMEEAGQNVKKVISRRMTKKAAMALGAICLGLYSACFLPFLFANNGTSETGATAIVLIAAAVGTLAAVLLVCLLCLKAALIKAIKAYNNTARGILGDIHGALNRFSKYLSACCNVLRGHAVQNYARLNVDEYTKSLRIRKKHKEDIRRLRAYIAEGYGDYLGGPAFCDETMARPYEYDFDQKTEYSYPAPFLAGDCRQIEFISSGNYVVAPSSYISSILVRMEGIYER